MTPTDASLIDKIRTANLVGRGGAGFPVSLKWLAVRKAEGAKKYVVCNASEHELGVFKDHFLLKEHLPEVFTGMRLAMDFVGTKEGVINLNEHYAKEFKSALEEELAAMKKKGYHMHLYAKCISYIGGEETALMEAIEGRRTQPRIKPPYPTQIGLYEMPTLVQNVETLYDISLVANGTYEGKRHYSISGAGIQKGVFHLPADWPIRKILEETGNLPTDPFFVQEGGGASGRILNAEQIAEEKTTGAGAIIVHHIDENPRELLLTWLRFYDQESCGKCAPCREGTFQLRKLVEEHDEIPWKKIEPILEVLATTSFCPLGKSVPVSIRTYRENIIPLL